MQTFHPFVQNDVHAHVLIVLHLTYNLVAGFSAIKIGDTLK